MTERQPTAFFDLQGTALSVHGPAALLDPLLYFLAELRRPAPPPGQPFSLTLSYQESHPDPAGLVPIYEGPLLEGMEARIFEDAGTRHLLIPGRLSASYSLAGHAATIAASHGAAGLAGGTAGILALETAAQCSGQTLVHAAALALPGQQAAVLMFAPSGTGKTTAALALATAGFSLLSDDAVFIAATAAGGHQVWGLPRPLKVHHRTAAMLPAIGALLAGEWNDEGEQVLHRQALATLAPVPPPRPVPLAAIISLEDRTGTAGHRLSPAPRAEVLVRLAANNVGQSLRGVLAAERRRWEALAAAAARVPTWRLNVGTDLSTLPGTVLAALGQPGMAP